MDKITLVITAQTLNTLGLALGELPFKIAKPAFEEIQAQVAAHEARNAAKNQGQPATDRNDQPGGVGGGDSGVGPGVGDGEVGTA
jgi:hypothetical protein